MLTSALLEILPQLAPTVAQWPRRQPGLLMVDGKKLRYSDMHSFFHQTRQIFGDNLYDFKTDSASPVILDCGAHIGMASLYFKERYPNARITAFEADPQIADMCRANFKTFGAEDADVQDAANWIHDEGVSFNTSNDDAGHVEDGADNAAVSSVRLKTLLEKEQVDLLKLDVEGAEFAIFDDCGDALRNAERIVAEVHAMDDTQANIGGLLSHLEKTGFRYALGNFHPATWLTPTAKPPFSFCPTEKFIVSVFAWQP